MSQENFSLHNIEHFNKTLDININDCVLNKYIELVTEYLNFIFKNIKIKGLYYSKFIIIRGLETLTNVFNNLLYYTKNIDLTYYHCQKSFYYYAEFISEITEDQNVFLNLSSRDATTYVYKKTLFEINNTYRKNMISSQLIIDQFNLIHKNIQIFNIIILKILSNENLLLQNNTAENTINIQKTYKICNKINKLKLDIGNLDSIELFILFLDNKMNNVDKFMTDKFMEIILLYFKKIHRNINIIKKINDKIYLEDFDIYLEETPDKLIAWLLN